MDGDDCTDPLRAHAPPDVRGRRREPGGNLVFERLPDEPLHDEERRADDGRIGTEFEDPRHRRTARERADGGEHAVLERHVVRRQQPFPGRLGAQDAVEALEQVGLVRVAGRQRDDSRDGFAAAKVQPELPRQPFGVARHTTAALTPASTPVKPVFGIRDGKHAHHAVGLVRGRCGSGAGAWKHGCGGHGAPPWHRKARRRIPS